MFIVDLIAAFIAGLIVGGGLVYMKYKTIQRKLGNTIDSLQNKLEDLEKTLNSDK